MATKDTGNLGEDIATRFLLNKGFEIIERNYKNKIGEIDIIGKKDNKLSIFEVKSVSYETYTPVSRENRIRPEENVDNRKIQKIRKVAEYYMMKNKISHETEIEFYVVSVIFCERELEARVKLIKDVL